MNILPELTLDSLKPLLHLTESGQQIAKNSDDTNLVENTLKYFQKQIDDLRDKLKLPQNIG